MFARTKVSIFVVGLLLLAPSPSFSSPNIKAGSVCKKADSKRVSNGKTLTCLKKGKKYIWVSGRQVPVAKPNPSPSSTSIESSTSNTEPVPTVIPSAKPVTVENYNFEHHCDVDPFVPNLWKPFQDLEAQRWGCPPPYRYLERDLPTETPLNQQTEKRSLNDVEQCKNDSTRSWTWGGFLGPEAKKERVIQVVPFYMSDGIPSTTPSQDWEAAIQFALDGLTKMSDHPLKIRVKIPEAYYLVDGNLKSFGLGNDVMHGDPNFNNKRWELVEKIVAATDSKIDFSEADMVWFLAPSNVKRSVLANHIAYGRALRTAEKVFSVNTSTYISSPINDFSKDFPQREPFGFIHELIHITDALDDHYGNGLDDLGTGSWGNMSGAMFDFLAWDKWSLGWINNSQVRCAPRNTTSTHWIKPSTIRGAHEKLLMIPISRTKSIAVESIRNSGFNFKIPVTRLGALVYTVDTSLLDDRTKHGDGLNVICPSRGCSNSPTSDSRFKLPDATLKLGESVEVMGYRISVIEAGAFGDVIRVDKIVV